MKDLRIMRRLVCLILLASVWAAAPARADVITQWNEQVFALGGASRTLAMVHVAMFDAFNAIQPRYQPYLQLPAAPVGALPEAAAASAAYGVLVRLLPGQVAQLNATLALSLASLPDGAGKTSGMQYRRHRRGRDVSKQTRRQHPRAWADLHFDRSSWRVSNHLPWSPAAGQHERAELDSLRAHVGVAVPTLCPAGAHIQEIR